MEGILIQDMIKAMQLTSLTPEVSLEDIRISNMEINRPALQLTGFFEFYDPTRIQVVGKVENAYLESLPEDERTRVMENLLEHGMPCLIMTRGYRPPESVLAQAWRFGIPILSTIQATSQFTMRLLRYLEVELAPMQAIHGVLVDVFGEGVLILGDSGLGKSEAALELIKRGHRLVADDTVEIRRYSEKELVGQAPEITRYLMELRGIGIIDIKALFGVERVKDKKTISMAIRLKDWAANKEFDRLGMQDEYVEYLGNRIPCYTVPLSPGRNLAVIVETAAINARQKRMGYDAMEELQRRLTEKMLGSGEKA